MMQSMFFLEFLFAFVLALVIAGILAAALSRSTDQRSEIWPLGLFFFVLLLFTIWAGGVWIAPVGPELWGVSWVPYVIIGIIVALLLAASVPSQDRWRSAQAAAAAGSGTTTATPAEGEVASAVALSVFFWIVVAALIAAIAARYVWWP
jgi:hypothetical protein